MRPTPISIGDLNQRVTFYSQATSGVDAYNMPKISTGSAVERWASVVVKPKGYRKEGSEAIEYHDTYEIKVRRPLSIAQGDRVDFDSLTLNVIGVNYSDKNYLIIQATGRNASI